MNQTLKIALNRIRDLTLDNEALESELSEAQERIEFLEAVVAQQHKTDQNLEVA